MKNIFGTLLKINPEIQGNGKDVYLFEADLRINNIFISFVENSIVKLWT